MIQAQNGNNVNTIESQMVPLLLSNGKEGLKHLLYYQVVTKAVPTILKGTAHIVKGILQSRMRKHLDHISTISVKKKTASVVLQRDYDKENDLNILFDAVLSFVSELPQTKHVKRTTTGVFIMASNDEIEISPGINVRKMGETLTNEKISKLVIEVYSYNYDLTSLRKYIEEIEEKYKMAISNQLGKNIFYFDELPISLPMGLNKKPDLSKAPQKLIFSKYPLYTNKSLKNIYGDSVKVIRKRVDFFVNNKRWYEDKGVPYTLGLLLHGVPGAGKTSCIKSIAKDTNRHVLNIRLSESTTVSQLNALFYSSQVQVLQNGENKFYDIPIDKRIIVLEDVDCLTDVVLSREAAEMKKSNDEKNNEGQKEDDDVYGARNMSYQAPMGGAGASQKLNLSILLNILDGVLEQPGRILIMTSNHPEKLDKALIRPGRIDVIVKFDYCKRHEVVEIIEAFTNKKVNVDKIDKIIDGEFTPAEVTRIIFENIEDINDIIENLSRKPQNNVVVVADNDESDNDNSDIKESDNEDTDNKDSDNKDSDIKDSDSEDSDSDDNEDNDDITETLPVYPILKANELDKYVKNTIKDKFERERERERQREIQEREKISKEGENVIFNMCQNAIDTPHCGIDTAYTDMQNCNTGSNLDDFFAQSIIY
jgi:SpoVK/Ycf46/Vps4 family AAA+-type ATPase